jgi:hypothetical protein
MNKISEPALGREWPKIRWEEIERIALADAAEYRHLPGASPEFARQANKMTQACLERFTRALVRLFILGGLGSLARSQYALFYDFMRLEDGELGHKAYDP